MGVKLAFVSLDWSEQVRPGRLMTEGQLNAELRTDEKNGWRCGREAYGFVLDNELFNHHRSAGKETVDQGYTLMELWGTEDISR